MANAWAETISRGDLRPAKIGRLFPFTMNPQHNEKEQRFVLHFPEGEAVLEYERTGSGVDFTHTFVAPALRGRGVAEALVKAGLAWAHEQQLQVAASCSYVARYLERHRGA